MRKNEIVENLDKKFNVYSVTDVWSCFDYLIEPIKEYCTSPFLEYYSGLMIDYCENASEIITTTFVTENIFKYIKKQGKTDVFIFTHHPFYQNMYDYSLENHISDNLNIIKNNRVSIYSCHLPLDMLYTNHSTGYYLADKLMKDIESGFYAYDGYLEKEIPCGYYGKSKENLFDISHRINKHFSYYKSFEKEPNFIACVPGGGNEIEFIKEAKSLGVDTYITGIVEMRGDNSVSKNVDFFKKINELEINLIGLGHYQTESLAMRGLIGDYFKEKFDCPVSYFSDEYYE